MAGLCTAAMLVSSSAVSVWASENVNNLDPSNENKQKGNTEVTATVIENTNKPDYLITIPQTVDFGTLKQPTTDADAYSSADITVTCERASGLTAGQGIAVLVKDNTAGAKTDPFILKRENSENSLTYEMYSQNSNVQEGTWYENGFMFITFTGAPQEHTNQLKLNLKQLYGKNISDWQGQYTGTLNFYTRIVNVNGQ